MGYVPFYRPDPGESNTIIIWETDEARQAYRRGALIKEAIALETKMGTSVMREAYPLLCATAR